MALIQIDRNKTIAAAWARAISKIEEKCRIWNLLGARCGLNSDAIKRAAQFASLCVNLRRARSLGSGNMKGELW